MKSESNTVPLDYEEIKVPGGFVDWRYEKKIVKEYRFPTVVRKGCGGIAPASATTAKRIVPKESKLAPRVRIANDGCSVLVGSFLTWRNWLRRPIGGLLSFACTQNQKNQSCEAPR
jgi:hypothetical protein